MSRTWEPGLERARIRIGFSALAVSVSGVGALVNGRNLLISFLRKERFEGVGWRAV